MPQPDTITSVRVGIHRGIRGAIDTARAAEDAGFDQIWFSNDIFASSGVVALSAVATATSRIQLGIGVLEPVSMHPAQIAMIAAALQDLSGGRLLLGIGAGSPVFFGFAGITAPRSPLRHTAATITALRHLLAGRSPADDSHAGDGWTSAARLLVPPHSPPPIYVGAMGPNMLALAGRMADGALPLCLPPERFLRAQRDIDRGRSGSVRAADEFDLAACIWCAIDDEPTTARRLLAGFIARYSGSLAPAALAEEGFDPAEFERVQQIVLRDGLDAGTSAVSADMLRLGIAGGPADVLARCQALVAAGARHISFGPPLGCEPDDAIRRLGADVLPLLRGATSVSAGTPAVVGVPTSGLGEALAGLYRPSGVRQGVLTTDRLAAAHLAEIDAAVISAGNLPSRRVARVRPRGSAVRVTADEMIEFIALYGHEYGVAVFDAVDSWSPGERRRIAEEAQRHGCSLVWLEETER